MLTDTAEKKWVIGRRWVTCLAGAFRSFVCREEVESLSTLALGFLLLVFAGQVLQEHVMVRMSSFGTRVKSLLFPVFRCEWCSVALQDFIQWSSIASNLQIRWVWISGLVAHIAVSWDADIDFIAVSIRNFQFGSLFGMLVQIHAIIDRCMRLTRHSPLIWL
jgi:hypothetical protein